ncbi:MAG: hypothetical protein ACRDGE_12235 [Candidatus Limnocylindria bacterium]
MGVWAVATTAVFAIAVAVLAYREFRAYLVWLEAVRLRAQAKPLIDRRLEQLAGRLEPAEIAPILAADLTSRDTTALVVDRSGRVIGSAPPLEGPEPPLLPRQRYARALGEDPHVTSIARDARGRRVLSVLIPPLPWRPDPPAVVQLATYLDSRERPFRLMQILAAAILADSILLVLVEVTLEGPATLLALVAVPLVWVAARLARGGGPLTVEGERRPSARAEGSFPLAAPFERSRLRSSPSRQPRSASGRSSRRPRTNCGRRSPPWPGPPMSCSGTPRATPSTSSGSRASFARRPTG